jgi:transposase
MRDMTLVDADRATLLAVIEAQAQEIAVLRAQVAELAARLGQNSTNSSRPPSSDRPGGRSQPPATGPSGRRPGGQPGHRGHYRELVPSEDVDCIVPLVPQACAGCGGPLSPEATATDPPVTRWQRIDVPPLRAQVTEYQLAARRCTACGQFTRAALPPAVGPHGFGPRLMAVVALLSGRYRLSKREAGQCVGDLFGVDLAVGSVAAVEQAASAALEPVVTEMRAAVQQAAVANLDETGWRQGRQRAWVWTVVTATLTVFHIDASRGGKVAQALLGALWAGVVGSDRGTMYSWLERERRQVCWAHLKRDFQKLVDWSEGSRPIGKRLLALEAEVFTVWYRFRREEIDRATLQQEVAPLQAAMHQVLEEAAVGPNAKAAGVCHELLKVWPALWTFVQVEGVEPTNNAAERALRPAVLWRKGSFGTHSADGSRFVERMLTVTATCRQQDRPLFAFLVQALDAASYGTPPPSLLSVQAI